MMDDLGIVLSRVTVRRFRQAVRGSGFVVRTMALTGFGHKATQRLIALALDSLARLPLVDELLTSRVNCQLQKPLQGEASDGGS
jgi:hypothetical protein